MDEAIQILTFDELPLPEEFASHVESKNIPAVFRGCIKDWIAFSSWNPSNGGLDYLEERVGSSVVEAMLSESAPVFYGDLRRHERVPLPFSSFTASCKCLEKTGDSQDVWVESEEHGLKASGIDESCSAVGLAPHQVYLAQVPIVNIENEERSQLETLRDDIQVPKILETKSLASINLWMNNAQSRSSTHYDPHQNLLCVIAGRKSVLLWPPSMSPLLYPMSLYGEASNHSSVNLENPDFSIHSRAKYSVQHSQKAVLHAGDALFIPEGWSSVGNGKSESNALRQHNKGDAGYQSDDLVEQTGNNDFKMNNQKQNIMLHQLEPLVLHSLHELVSIVHDNVKVGGQTQPVQSTSINDSTINLKDEIKKTVTEKSFDLGDDPITGILSNLEALKLRNVLLAMAQSFPRTLEALILHSLSPVGAEVLTQKFDEIDQQTSKEERNEFYQTFYGAFDDQFSAMDAILNRKESFALQAFRNVLEKYVGVNYAGPKPLVG